MRQYETHNDPMKITFEHEVLEALQRSNFKLDTPSPVRRLSGEAGTFLPVKDTLTGHTKIATLFHYREGVNPIWDNQINYMASVKRRGPCLLLWQRWIYHLNLCTHHTIEFRMRIRSVHQNDYYNYAPRRRSH